MNEAKHPYKEWETRPLQQEGVMKGLMEGKISWVLKPKKDFVRAMCVVF